MSNKKSDFWYYTRGERQATVLLLTLVALIFLLPAVYQSRPLEAELIDRPAFIQAIQQLESQASEQESPKVAGVFYFDPNTADQDVLQSLGLSSATARTIINYREKVGAFQQAEDLKKIYNLAEADYQRLVSYIKIKSQKKAAPSPDKRSTAPPPALFAFDPNTAALEDLTRLGLSSKTAGTLIRYREKGGVFRLKADLKKVYGIREQDYKRLEAFISLPEHPATTASREPLLTNDQAPQAVQASYVSPTPVLVDINQSTATDWQRLYGIGPALSGRIVKFRDKLGGFTHIDQVAETYGLPDSTFQSIRSHLKVSPLNKMIAINSVSAKELQSHPYIQWQQANVIIAYREQHGPFQTLEDLSKVLALKADFIQRIKPYIQYE